MTGHAPRLFGTSKDKEPRPGSDPARAVARLRQLAERLERGALTQRNADGSALAERRAIALEKEARALRWAIAAVGDPGPSRAGFGRVQITGPVPQQSRR